MNLYPLVLFILFVGTVNAQLKKGAELYNQAVIKYNEQSYQEAEKLFTRSLDASADMDAYFSRGLCRGKLADQKGYCSDMAQATVAGHEKAPGLFTKSCGKVDTILEKRPGDAPHNIVSRVLIFHAGDTTYRFIQKYFSQEVSSGYAELIKSNSQDTTGGQTQAQFSGGTMEMMKFIQRNLRFPQGVYVESGKVFLSFMIFEDGTIHDIKVLKNATNHPAYAEEATRVLALMPPWQPAKVGKKLVKCFFNMPISFKVQ